MMIHEIAQIIDHIMIVVDNRIAIKLINHVIIELIVAIQLSVHVLALSLLVQLEISRRSFDWSQIHSVGSLEGIQKNHTTG